MATLDEACRLHPDAKWWIKADGCDIISGLEESLQLVWNGDVDFGTSEVQLLYSLYRRRLELLDKLACDESVKSKRKLLVQTLQQEQSTLCTDIQFIAESEMINSYNM